jgi:hypothetical protein
MFVFSVGSVQVVSKPSRPTVYILPLISSFTEENKREKRKVGFPELRNEI